MRTWFLCRCGKPIHRISATRYLHDNGRDECADGEAARSTVADVLPDGYDPEEVAA